MAEADKLVAAVRAAARRSGLAAIKLAMREGWQAEPCTSSSISSATCSASSAAPPITTKASRPSAEKRAPKFTGR